MNTVRLWTKHFIALVLSNAFMFGGFHILLPTLPIYAAYNGATGAEIGLITGIFGFSAIFIRLFTDLAESALGKKKCLYLGLAISFICTVSYIVFTSVEGMIATRIFHGFGFGLTTTFYAAIAADIIPYSRRGEGMGYFGLGSTVAMALAPAAGVWLVNDYGFVAMFVFSAFGTGLAFLGTLMCRTPNEVSEPILEESRSLLDKFFERGTGFPALLTMLFGIGYGSVNTFVAMLAQEAHIANSGYFFIVGTLCVFLSRPVGGRIFDSKGPAWIIFPGCFFLLSGLVVLTQTSSLTLLLTAAVLYGFGGGFLLPALITWMLNLVQPDRRSGASATFYNMLDVGTSAGAIFLGTIAEKTGFIGMYKYSAGAMLIFLIAFSLYIFIHGNVGTAKKEVAAMEIAPEGE
ncbi:MAG: quinolone resistance protein [Firmicutes bacterium]|nr:quinolone resistance protein [Bacillota bacterium]